MGSPPIAFWLYFPLAALALLGAVLVAFALFRDRSRSRRRCPKCWYDMAGAAPTPPVRCPECGHLARTERELARTHRRWGLAAVAAVLVIPLLVLFAVRDGARVYYAVMPRWKAAEEIRINGTRAIRYVVRDPQERGGRFVLLSNGRSVLDVEDIGIEFGQRPFNQGAPAVGEPARVGAGEEGNSDGKRYLVVFCYSGGAHCCYTVYVVDLADPPRLIATIDARNGMGLSRAAAGEAHFPDLEFNIADQSFDYWNAPHAASPAPSVWYRIENGSLCIALDKMIRPSEAVLARHPKMRLQRNGPEGGGTPATGERVSAPAALDPGLWSCMLDLLYSGNEQECWRVFDAGWPRGFAGPPSKEGFRQEFLSILDKSPQWRDFRAAFDAAGAGKAIPPATVGNYQPPPSTAPAR